MNQPSTPNSIDTPEFREVLASYKTGATNELQLICIIHDIIRAHVKRTPAAPEPQADTIHAWFHQISSFGPWVECNPSAPGAQVFYSGPKVAAALCAKSAPAAPTDAKPTMICPQCGADRFKVPCPGMADDCAMIADAHLQSVRDAAQPTIAAEDVRDAVRWRFLRDLKCNSLHVTRDDHACNYVSAKQWIEEDNREWFDGTPAEELQAMKDANTIWTVQVYPDTPIGFYTFYGASLDSAIDAAIASTTTTKG